MNLQHCHITSITILWLYLDLETECIVIRHPRVVEVDGRHEVLTVPHHIASAIEELLANLSTYITGTLTSLLCPEEVSEDNGNMGSAPPEICNKGMSLESFNVIVFYISAIINEIFKVQNPIVVIVN